MGISALPPFVIVFVIVFLAPFRDGGPQEVLDGAEWIDVPVFVVDTLDVEDQSWLATDGWRSEGEDLRQEITVHRGADLDLFVSDHNGLSGTDLFLRLRCAELGRLTAEARSVWHTDVGDHLRGPNTDLHGVVQIEARRGGDGETPLRLKFRLFGIQSGFVPLAMPKRIEGEIVLPLRDLGWRPRVVFPRPPAPDRATTAKGLRKIERRWPNDKQRACGPVDASGRRQGTWTTWYETGVKQSESVFKNGVREGRWVGYHDTGKPFEAGPFVNGLRDGEWTESWTVGEQVTSGSGLYVADEKEGEWVERWGDGSLRARGEFEKGRETGPWTRWWPNGNKLCEGVMEGGRPVGKWTYWHEDGTVRMEREHRRPGGARKCPGAVGSR